MSSVSRWRTPGSGAFYASESQLKRTKETQLLRAVVKEEANYRTKPNKTPDSFRPVHRSPRPGAFFEADVAFLHVYRAGPHRYAFMFMDIFSGKALFTLVE